ncbi:hypothetical protein J1N35_024160 [Gossypium stocksii]|uniref:Protein kinase domain-containing protein n=1 Tax=Gossypium stocksii TaxID=47602 RepID=A0A9D4A4Y5_9ROSI|nr:hypothetical protein J1N35_024160 [Gossypium stocksii]
MFVGLYFGSNDYGELPWDTCDRDDLRDKLLRGESPNISEDMSKLGKSFLKECFAIDPNKMWNASKLLCHQYLLLPKHMLPRDHQQSLPCFQQQKVLQSRNIHHHLVLTFLIVSCWKGEKS